ncbi:hypothetical protein D3C71_1290000 [compost metagenome]
MYTSGRMAWKLANFSLVSTGKPESHTESYGMRAMSAYGKEASSMLDRTVSTRALYSATPMVPSEPPCRKWFEVSVNSRPPA